MSFFCEPCVLAESEIDTDSTRRVWRCVESSALCGKRWPQWIERAANKEITQCGNTTLLPTVKLPTVELTDSSQQNTGRPRNASACMPREAPKALGNRMPSPLPGPKDPRSAGSQHSASLCRPGEHRPRPAANRGPPRTPLTWTGAQLRMTLSGRRCLPDQTARNPASTAAMRVPRRNEFLDN